MSESKGFALANVSIRARLIGLVIAAGTVSAGLGWLSWWSQQQNQDMVRSLERTAQVVRSAMMTDMMHDAVHAEVVSAALAKTTQDQAAFDQASKALDENLKVLVDSYADAQAKAPTDQARDALEKAKPTVLSYRQSAISAMDRIRSGDKPAEALQAFNQAFEETEKVLDRVGDLIEESASATTALANEQSAATQRNTLIGVFLGLGLLAMLTPPLIISILKPIYRLFKAVETLNTDDGDLSHRLHL